MPSLLHLVLGALALGALGAATASSAAGRRRLRSGAMALGIAALVTLGGLLLAEQTARKTTRDGLERADQIRREFGDAVEGRITEGRLEAAEAAALERQRANEAREAEEALAEEGGETPDDG